MVQARNEDDANVEFLDEFKNLSMKHQHGRHGMKHSSKTIKANGMARAGNKRGLSDPMDLKGVDHVVYRINREHQQQQQVDEEEVKEQQAKTKKKQRKR